MTHVRGTSHIRMRHIRFGLAFATSLALAATSGCTGFGPSPGPAPQTVEPLSLSALAQTGDAPRRASMRLVLDGLDAEARGRRSAALSSYDRALQVDPNNPYAYLALARSAVEEANGPRALVMLDKCEALLRALGEESPGARAAVDGLRGAALRASGRIEEGDALLAQAGRAAPSVWGDGQLDAIELQ